jgi:hypothetical protein
VRNHPAAVPRAAAAEVDPSGNAPPPAASQDGSAGTAPATPSSPSIGDVLSPIGNPANVLKGLFGR